MFNFIINTINEIKSYFVPERLNYKIIGECKKCGKCCNYVYGLGMENEREFKFMQLLFPSYRRFYYKGRDEDGNMVFACKFVTKEGLCSVYKKRPKICRDYPAKSIKYCAKLHEGCGYIVESKTFGDYLK